MNMDREYPDEHEDTIGNEAEEQDELVADQEEQAEQYFRGVDRRRRLKIAVLGLSVLIVVVVGVTWIAIASTTAATSSASRDGAVGSAGHQVAATGIGAAATPTPTGVTGYLQARYLDPGQAQSNPIQLTSLHSAAADEPYGGHDGGLIGVHFNTTATGTASHGCIRLAPAAITAVNALPVGTPITITD